MQPQNSQPSQSTFCQSPKLPFPYKKISLQSLQPRPQILPKPMTQQQLIHSMNWKFRWRTNPVLCYTDTGLGNERIVGDQFLRGNAFFQAFLYAYKQHGDVLLIPDQVWIMVCFYVAGYVDRHAEKLRSKLVAHQGVKIITVKQQVESAQHSLTQQQTWQPFFTNITNQLQSSTKAPIVQTLTCNFSTTTPTYKIISSAIIMNSLKKLFEYHRSFCICGINNVYMAGEREDWVKMGRKLEDLVQFDVDGELRKYVEYVGVIFGKFLGCFDGDVDLGWWNTIMQSLEHREVYGGQSTEVDGWILHFFGIYEKHEFKGFPEMTIKVPIQLINEATGIQKQLLLVSDWCSVSKLDERTYKPDVGLCIFVMKEEQIKDKAKDKDKDQVQIHSHVQIKSQAQNHNKIKDKNTDKNTDKESSQMQGLIGLAGIDVVEP